MLMCAAKQGVGIARIQSSGGSVPDHLTHQPHIQPHDTWLPDIWLPDIWLPEHKGRFMPKVLTLPSGIATARLLALALVATLSGCAQMYAQHDNTSGSVIAGGDQGTPVGASLSGFLNEANRGEAVRLAQSPWGPGVNVYSGQPYYAASGRTCRELTVQGNGGERAVIACKMADDQWVTRRQITTLQSQGGRR